MLGIEHPVDLGTHRHTQISDIIKLFVFSTQVGRVVQLNLKAADIRFLQHLQGKLFRAHASGKNAERCILLHITETVRELIHRIFSQAILIIINLDVSFVRKLLALYLNAEWKITKLHYRKLITHQLKLERCRALELLPVANQAVR